jgi:hypothetical protein
MDDRDLCANLTIFLFVPGVRRTVAYSTARGLDFCADTSTVLCTGLYSAESDRRACKLKLYNWTRCDLLRFARQVALWKSCYSSGEESELMGEESAISARTGAVARSGPSA